MIRSHWSNIFFVWAHPGLVFCMLQTTVGIVTLYDAILEEDSIEQHFRRMISLGAFMQMILLIFMRVAHKGINYMLGKPSRVVHFCVRIIFSIFHFVMRWFRGSPEHTIMLHALIASTINCLDIYVALNAKGRKEVHEEITMGIYSAKRQRTEHVEIEQTTSTVHKDPVADNEPSPSSVRLSDEKQTASDPHSSSSAVHTGAGAEMEEGAWVNENPISAAWCVCH